MNRKICVVGLGYVGLPLAVEFGKKQRVVGFDVSARKISELKQGIESMGEVDVSELKLADIEYTTDATAIKKCDFIIAAVPTPVDEHNVPDMKFVEGASHVIGKNLSHGAIVVFESTVYPGVTEDICIPIIEKESGLKCGKDWKIGYSPERVNPGDKEHTVNKITKVVSGMDAESLEIIAEVYSSMTTGGVFRATSIKVAEAAKVIENTQRDLNIALMNELSIIFRKMDISTKDVVEAAATKWNFHKYTPGMVGGHCLEKSQLIFCKINNEYSTLTVKELYEKYSENKKLEIQILSFDLKKRISLFKKVSLVTKRVYSNLIKIKTATNQTLKVTDDHPVVVFEKDEFKIKLAKDLQLTDRFATNTKLPVLFKNQKIDVISTLNEREISRTRIQPISKKLKEYKKLLNIKINTGKKASNFYSGNYLPLSVFLELEKTNSMPLKREEIYLVTGKGPSFNRIKAVLEIDANFARLIGYYISEGCITKDKSYRTRWTFSSDEKEYIKDVCECITALGCKYSIYNSKTDKASTIKLSSNIFSHIILNVLKCGKDSYDAKIPDQLMYSDVKLDVLKGIIRGDGGVTLYDGSKEYVKNNKIYDNKFCSCEMNFFSISKKCFHQTILLLNDFGITSSYDLKRNFLCVHGHENLQKTSSLFLGDKEAKIKHYFKNKNKFVISKKYDKLKDLLIVDLKEISKETTDEVYSLEVDGTETIITDFGLITHNCIGVDPYYLTYKAEELGYKPRVILAGREINDNMSKYIAEYLIKEMIKKSVMINHARVLILGLTFKENVKDARNSKTKDLIKELREYGVDVVAYEPHLNQEEIDHEGFNIKNTTLSEVGKVDAIVLTVPHKEFLSLTPEKYASMMNSNKIFMDVKGFTQRKKFEDAGFTYLVL